MTQNKILTLGLLGCREHGPAHLVPRRAWSLVTSVASLDAHILLTNIAGCFHVMRMVIGRGRLEVQRPTAALPRRPLKLLITAAIGIVVDYTMVMVVRSQQLLRFLVKK